MSLANNGATLRLDAHHSMPTGSFGSREQGLSFGEFQAVAGHVYQVQVRAGSARAILTINIVLNVIGNNPAEVAYPSAILDEDDPVTRAQ